MASNPSHSSSSTAPILPQQDPHDVNVQRHYHYPIIHRPPPAHVNYGQRSSEAQRTESTRVQSSISSAESNSTVMSGLKQSPSPQSPQTYWHASNAEKGFMNENARSSRAHSIQNNGTHSPSRQEMVEDNSAVLRYIQAQQRIEEEEEKEDDHGIWIMFWLSCLDPIHSFISAIYTLLVVLTLTLAYPIRICKSQSSLGDQLIRIMAPLFRNHLDMLYAPSVEDAYTFEFKPASLIMVNLSSPFLSIGVMFATWVAAAFWVFAIIMGNPDGTEKGDDGRDAVLSVRNWWEKYLLNAVKR